LFQLPLDLASGRPRPATSTCPRKKVSRSGGSLPAGPAAPCLPSGL
jgi:hypothetical protein